MDPDDKMKALSDFSDTINRIAQSLKHGNTNQVGRDAWHLYMQYIVNGVTCFVNRLNHDYIGLGVIINPNNFPNFLFPGLLPAINTCVYNNAFEISIGIVSSSLDREDLNDVHTSAIEDIQCPTDDDDDEDGAEAGGAAGGPPDPAHGPPDPAGDPDPAGGDAPPPPSSPHTQKCWQAKELMRTLSSAMEKPYWDTCQKAERSMPHAQYCTHSRHCSNPKSPKLH